MNLQVYYYHLLKKSMFCVFCQVWEIPHFIELQMRSIVRFFKERYPPFKTFLRIRFINECAKVSSDLPSLPNFSNNLGNVFVRERDTHRRKKRCYLVVPKHKNPSFNIAFYIHIQILLTTLINYDFNNDLSAFS